MNDTNCPIQVIELLTTLVIELSTSAALKYYTTLLNMKHTFCKTNAKPDKRQEDEQKENFIALSSYHMDKLTSPINSLTNHRTDSIKNISHLEPSLLYLYKTERAQKSAYIRLMDDFIKEDKIPTI